MPCFKTTEPGQLRDKQSRKCFILQVWYGLFEAVPKIRRPRNG